MENKRWILITGAARRIGAILAVGLAKRGFNIVVHHGHSPKEAEQTAALVHAAGSQALIIQADLSDSSALCDSIFKQLLSIPLFALINNASIFESEQFHQVTLSSWDEHLRINLTAPLLLSQEFSSQFQGDDGRIINMLDWRALRPGQDHFSYTISKAALAALTKSLARALAPRISVNAIAMGAILPPSDGKGDENLIKSVPAQRWANVEEVTETVNFLLTGPSFITGEIIHLDGGRHLV